MLGFDGEYPAVHPKTKFWGFLVKNCKKYFKKNLFCLSSWICLQPFVQNCLRKQIVISNSVQTLWFYLKSLEFENAHSLFKLIFKATQLQKISEYDIFRKTLFCPLASSMNLGLNALPVAAGKYLWRDFTFFY